jgi:hypothetical protein
MGNTDKDRCNALTLELYDHWARAVEISVLVSDPERN